MNTRDTSIVNALNLRGGDTHTSGPAGLESLLAAVVAACRCMVEHADLRTGLQAAMAQLGRLSGHDRAYVFELVDEQQTCVLIAEWDAPGIDRISDMAGLTRFSVSDFFEVWQPLLAGREYQSVTAAKTGANAELNQAVANRSDVMVPIFVGTRCWGCIGFDNCQEERRYGEAEIQALRGAAAAVAAAVQRSCAEAQAQAQARREHQLLTTVNGAARQLLAGPDFDASVAATLALLGTTFGVTRAGLVQDLPLPDGRGSSSWRMMHEWHVAGIPAQIGSAAETGAYPSDDWVAQLRSGQPLVVHVGDNPPHFDDGQAAIQTQTILSVPVFVAGTWWGIVGLDDIRPEREWASHEVAVLQIAASCIGAALERQQAEAQRLAVAQAHTAQAETLHQLTQGVVRATRELLDHADFASGVEAWLAHLGRAAEADVATLFQIVAGPSGSSAMEPSEATTASAWRRDGGRPRMGDVPTTSDFSSWSARLLAGEAVWASIDDLLDPASVRYWLDIQCATKLLMPVVANGTVHYVLCFNWRERREHSAAAEAVLRTAADSLTAVLQRELAARSLLAERERRIAIERQRADEAAALVARVERHAHLLEVVARAADVLLAAPTPAEGIDQVLEGIGAATGADRVCYAQLEFTPLDPELHGWQHITHEWTRPGALSQMHTGLRRYPMRRADATWQANLSRLKTAGWLRQLVDELDEPYRSEQRQLGVVWSLRYPVIVGERLVALLGLDCSGPFDKFEAATTDALQSVGSAIANALWRHELQQTALAAERARADENARLVSLLTQVVASSRLLIDAEPAELETAMLSWLGTMGRETRAIRATFYDLVTFAETGQLTTRMLCEWACEGVSGSVPCSFAQPYVIDPRGAEDVLGELTAGRVVAVHTDRTHGPMREFLEAQGNATVVAVPVFVAGRQWGVVSFDYAEHTEPGRADSAVLLTAADTLSAVLRRNETATALLAEREARLQAELRRNTELARVNEALRQALDALAGTEGEVAFLRDVLVQLQCHTGARAAYLFRSDDADGRLRLVGRSADGRFSERPADDDPPIFSSGFEMVPALMAQLRPGGRLLWRRVDPDTPVDDSTSESTRWHLRAGHRANAVQALMIGVRQVGFIGMVFSHDQPLSEAQLDLAHALTQPITLALELARLARLAQRGGEQAAMLKERNRLAREIHDGIAQSFLAIQMQLDALDERGAHAPTIQKALHLARHGLTEARRAVAALRPQGLKNSDLPAALQRLVQDTEGAAAVNSALVCPAVWQPLPAEVEDHLFRIVQEAVNNALRHAQPRQLRVELSQAAGEATVLVADDGSGFQLDRALSRQGFGLESMQQRAQLIGARIDWLTAPGKGTQVLVSWTSPAWTAELDAAPAKAAE